MRLPLIALPLITLAASLAIATPLVAQQKPMPVPGTRDATRVTAGSYTVDPGHTLVGWRVDHLGFNDYFGIFGDATGTLVIDPKKPSAATVDITIPVAKVTTASAGLTRHLLTKDFFGAAPADAKFVSTAVVAKGNTARITGNLTLNGVTKPVTLDAIFRGAGPDPRSKAATIGFEAKTTIKRSDFGIAYGIPLVSDQVRLDITVAFVKAG